MIISDVSIDRMVQISYEDDDCNGFQIKSDRPHADFVNALASLTPVLARHLDLSSIAKRVQVTGIEVGESNDGETTYKILGKLNCPKFDNGFDLKINTPKMVEAYDDFFESDEDREPEEYPWLLLDEEVAAIRKVLAEAEKYINGLRKPDPQGDLFEDADRRMREAEKIGAKTAQDLKDKMDELGGTIYVGGEKVYEGKKKEPKE